MTFNPYWEGSIFEKKLNMPFQTCLYGQVAWLWQFVSTSDLPDQNNKPKRNFRGKLGQSLTFDLAVWCPICELWKNVLISLFLVSSFFTVPIFAHIRLAGSEQHTKTWFRVKLAQILNFDPSVRGQICEFEKMTLWASSQGQVA